MLVAVPSPASAGVHHGQRHQPLGEPGPGYRLSTCRSRSGRLGGASGKSRATIAAAARRRRRRDIRVTRAATSRAVSTARKKPKIAQLYARGGPVARPSAVVRVAIQQVRHPVDQLGGERHRQADRDRSRRPARPDRTQR